MWPHMGFKVPRRSPRRWQRLPLPPDPGGGGEQGCGSGHLGRGCEEQALPLWAGRHRLAGTVPSERGVPAAWVSCSGSWSRVGTECTLLPGKFYWERPGELFPARWDAPVAPLTFGMFLCFVTATFGSRVTL